MNVLLKLNLVNRDSNIRHTLRNIVGSILHNHFGEDSFTFSVVLNTVNIKPSKNFKVSNAEELKDTLEKLINECVSEYDLSSVLVTVMCCTKAYTQEYESDNYDVINCDFMSTIKYYHDNIQLYMDGVELVSSDDSIDNLLSLALTI